MYENFVSKQLSRVKNQSELKLQNGNETFCHLADNASSSLMLLFGILIKQPLFVSGKFQANECFKFMKNVNNENLGSRKIEEIS